MDMYITKKVTFNHAACTMMIVTQPPCGVNRACTHSHTRARMIREYCI